MPERYEDIDDRFKNPELEQAYKRRAIDRHLENNDYSVFDVLTGKAMVNALNAIDDENEWELM